MNTVSSTFTVRVPEELKEKMRKYPVEWGEEVRRFVEARVRQFELAETIRNVGKRAKRRKVTVDSTGLIREDRER
ncbi:MAG: type II toxin-antitoxin system VapB family antitoxin [Candidatus Hecatellaceae archaeon]